MIEIDAKTRLIYAERKSDALTSHAMQDKNLHVYGIKHSERKKKNNAQSQIARNGERMNMKRERNSSHSIASIAETIEWWL